MFNGVIVNSDALGALRAMADNSVHCVVTSPPYFGLREYGTARWDGGDPACSHVVGNQVQDNKAPGAITSGIRPGTDASACRKCGARRVDQQLGIEKTPEEYVSNLVTIFREVWRVLHPSGSLWLNLGDSYWAGKGSNGSSKARRTAGERGFQQSRGTVTIETRATDGRHATIKPKDLLGIPWRVALALQADGWYLRSDVIWHKPNTMPESVRDRPTKAHEYLFLLTKSPHYYYDAKAVEEPSTGQTGKAASFKRQTKDHLIPNQSAIQHRLEREEREDTGTRQRRSVWSIPTKPYKDAHFATFPPDLVRPCIQASTSERGVCPKCLAPWERVLAKVGTEQQRWAKGAAVVDAQWGGVGKTSVIATGARAIYETTGWQPTCGCDQSGQEFKPDDFELIATPLGEAAGDDPTMTTGRRGMNRPRGETEGVRAITRYEQRMYAGQLRRSPHRQQMEATAGTAFAHYIRTDRSGARPLPPDLLEEWIGCGWLDRIVAPCRQPYEPVPAWVLDPFAGAGTTGLVAQELGREFVLVELNPDYCRMAGDRIDGKRPVNQPEQ